MRSARLASSGLIPSSRSQQRTSVTSRRLWGGMFVAMPTAMPVLPFTSRLGRTEGRERGSLRDSSKFGPHSTVSSSMSASISSPSS